MVGQLLTLHMMASEKYVIRIYPGFEYSDIIVLCCVLIQWNLSVTTTSMIKFIICDLFSNVF